MEERFSIFTETSENLGLLFNGYKKLYPIISKFLDKIDENITQLIKHPEDNDINLKDDIEKFKKDVNMKFRPEAIDPNNMKGTIKQIKDFRSKSDGLLDRLSKMKNRTAFGGNFARSVIKRPKVYSKEIDSANYTHINNGIRNIDRGLDWVEKVMIDLFNMIDQDLNILTIVNKIYIRKHIYECTYTEAANIDELISQGKISGDGKTITSKIWEDIGDKTPENLSVWMKDNIKYDKSITEWRWRTPAETFIDCRGNCHDQAMFTASLINSIDPDKYHAELLFFVEFSKDSEIGGNTHTLCYYKDYTKNYCYYWIENAWEDQQGIHGPYQNIRELKEAIVDVYNSDDDINSHKFDGIVFADSYNSSKRKFGCTLGEYVNSWTLKDDYEFDKNKTIEESFKFIESMLYESSEEENPFDECKTPNQLLNWMDCIQYGWWNSLTDEPTGLDTDEETDLFFHNYKLQSPRQTIDRKCGLCWDQCELERIWFNKHGYTCTVVYLEINDNEGNPSHTFLVFQDKNDNVDKCYYWFEHSWGQYKGIHAYSTLRELIHDVIDKHLKQNGYNDQDHRIFVTSCLSIPRYGMKYGEYTNWARHGFNIDLGDISNEIFGENAVNYTGMNLATGEKHRKLSKEEREKLEKKLIDLFGESASSYIESIPDIFLEAEAPKEDPPPLDNIEDSDVNNEEEIKEEPKPEEKEDKNSEAPPELNDDIQNEEIPNESDSEPATSEEPQEEISDENQQEEESKPEEEKPPVKESLPKQADRAESDKNGVRRKKLYVAFIEWAKEYNSRNTFGSVFDKEAFHDSYPFVPHEMRYFYRLANPMLCVLAGDLTFFQLAELRKVNAENKQLDDMMIFAATPNDLRVFNIKDKKVYIGEDSNGDIILKDVLGNTFDEYIQTMIQKGDILNAPLEDKSEETPDK